MRWKSFTVGIAALLAVVALPLTAVAATGPGAQHAHWFAGSVGSASSSSVSVNVLWTGKHDKELDGKTVSVAIDSSTQIHYGKGKSSIDPGDLVGVIATGTGVSSFTAQRINVRCNCHFAAGTVDAVSASTLRVNVTRSGPYDTVLKGNDVTFQIGSATLPSLSAGDKVAVVFSSTGFFKDPSFNWQTATFTIEHARKAKQ
jgi:hypothetical protein